MSVFRFQNALKFVFFVRLVSRSFFYRFLRCLGFPIVVFAWKVLQKSFFMEIVFRTISGSIFRVF